MNIFEIRLRSCGFQSWGARFIAISLCLTAVAAGGKKSDRQKKIPPFPAVQILVHKHFEEQDGFRTGDLISQSDVKGVLDALKKAGWEAPDRQKIIAAALPDADFLVRSLREKSGVQFMRQIAAFPLAYDRLDRLSQMTRGHKIVSDLIRAKGGYEMIEYMTTSRGGKNLGRQLARSPNGSDFNRPTGKIYTVEHLIRQLRAVHAEQIATRDADEKARATGKGGDASEDVGGDVDEADADSTEDEAA